MSEHTPFLALGIEGSANKIAVGLIGYDGTIYSNIRKTHVTPAGSGFIPRETQQHHTEHILPILEKALLAAHASLFPDTSSKRMHADEKSKKEAMRAVIQRITCICYTRGPGMAGCLGVGATVARTLAQLWGKQPENQSALQQLNEYISERGKRRHHPSVTPPNAFASVTYNAARDTLPVIGVNHCVAHIEMGRLACGIQPERGVHSIFQNDSVLSKESDSVVVLYVSGGNTQVITYSTQRYHIVGETIDIAVGNCIDRVARLLGVSNNPCAGVNIERLARVGRRRYEAFKVGSSENDTKEPNFLSLPYVVKGMDMSFSGLSSYCKELLCHEMFRSDTGKDALEASLYNWTDGTEAKNPKRKPKAKIDIAAPFDIYDVCWSIEEHIFAALVEVTERALCLSGAKDVLIVGGVGCNERLQEMMRLMTKQQNSCLRAFACELPDVEFADAKEVRSHDMDERYCIDNGCMIAYTGALEHAAYIQHENENGDVTWESNRRGMENVSVCQRYRTDDVWIGWYDL